MNMASVMMGWGAGVEEKGWRKGPWTPEEDKLLSEHVNLHGEGRWSSVARCTGLNRSGKSCRLRWVNYLRPGLKRGHLTPQEEGIIIELHALLGNKWSTIARYLPGRTDNEIKNYWRTHFKKKDKCTEKQQKRKAQILKEKQQQEEEEAAENDMESKKMKSAGSSTVPQKQDEAAACSELQNVISDELQPAQLTRSMHVPLTCPILEEIQCVPAARVSMSQLCGTTSTLESTLWSPDNNTTINIGSENDQGLWCQLWNLEDDHHTGYNKCSNSVAVQLNQAIKAPFSGGMHSEENYTVANNISWGENIHPGNYFYGGSGYIF